MRPRQMTQLPLRSAVVAPQNGRHGTFVRMPAGFKSPVHTHTEDYFAAVVEGVGSNHPVDAEAAPLPTGSYWFQRGEEAHVTECLFFIVQPGKFDYVVEQPADKK